MVNSFFIDYIIQDFCLRNTTSSARIEQHFSDQRKNLRDFHFMHII